MPPVHAMQDYASALRLDPSIVWHLALEYTIPHLGHTSDLMFGGLGKVSHRDFFVIMP